MIKYTTFDKLNLGDFFKFRLDDSEPRIFQKLVTVDPNGFTCALDIKTFKVYKPYAWDANAEVYRVDKEGEPLDMFKKVPFTYQNFDTDLLGCAIRWNGNAKVYYTIVGYGKTGVFIRSHRYNELHELTYDQLTSYLADKPLYTLE